VCSRKDLKRQRATAQDASKCGGVARKDNDYENANEEGMTLTRRRAWTAQGVDYLELISGAAQAPGLAAGAMAGDGAMGTAELADVFGIEIEDAAPVAAPFAPLAVAKPARAGGKKTVSRMPAVKPVRPAPKAAAKAKQTPPSKWPRKTAAAAVTSVRPKKSGDAGVKRRAPR